MASRPRHRAPASAGLGVVALLLATGVTGCADQPAHQIGDQTNGPPASAPTVPVPSASASSASSASGVTDRPATVPAARIRALEVLREWDARRAEALARADASALRELYVPGSGLARQDLALLAAYERRGVRLTGVVHQVTSVEVRLVTSRSLQLTVVERLAAARAGLGGEVERDLAGSRFARRTLRFERVRGSWRLSSVREG
jgi:hypothetical protein